MLRSRLGNTWSSKHFQWNVFCVQNSRVHPPTHKNGMNSRWTFWTPLTDWLCCCSHGASFNLLVNCFGTPPKNLFVFRFLKYRCLPSEPWVLQWNLFHQSIFFRLSGGRRGSSISKDTQTSVSRFWLSSLFNGPVQWLQTPLQPACRSHTPIFPQLWTRPQDILTSISYISKGAPKWFG